MSEQFERYLLQESSRGFFTKTAILNIFDVVKKDDGSYEISLKGNKPRQAGMKRQLESWDIEENDGKGDCMFEAMSQILNGGDSDPEDFIDVPEYKVNGKYTTHSIRRAISDYLRDQGRELFNSYRNNEAPQDLVELVKKQDELQELTTKQKQDIMQYKFMLNDDNSEFMDDEMIIDRISKPSNPNNVDEIESTVEETSKLPYDKYYWGDNLTIIAFEEIFNIKLVIIAKHDQNKTSIDLNSRVEFKEDEEIMYGTVRKLEDNGTATIITDNYVNYTKPVKELELVKLYTVLRNDSSLKPNKRTLLGFLFYHMNGSQGHYESIYKKGVVGRQINKKQYKFLPSIAVNKYPFIIYMIFLSIYGFDQQGEFVQRGEDSVFTAEKITKNESNPIRTVTQTMYKRYTNNLQGQETQGRRLSFQMGGQVKPYVTTYLQNSMNVDTKNTYYVVIDLDLYPGTSLTSGQKYRLSCANNYDKIKEAWSDIFGLQYEPGELDTSSVQSPIETQASAPPMAEAVPVREAKGGSRLRRTLKKPHKKRFTRHIHLKTRNKKSRKQKTKIKHKTRRTV